MKTISPEAADSRRSSVKLTVSGKRYPGFVYNLNTAEDSFHVFSTEDPSDARSDETS